jgi:hypothetical protein
MMAENDRERENNEKKNYCSFVFKNLDEEI